MRKNGRVMVETLLRQRSDSEEDQLVKCLQGVGMRGNRGGSKAKGGKMHSKVLHGEQRNCLVFLSPPW